MPRVSEMIGGRPITPTSGLWDALDCDTQGFLSDIAANVKVLLMRSKGDDAFDEMEGYGLDLGLLAAMWTLFDSGERRVLKAVQNARNARKEMT